MQTVLKRAFSRNLTMVNSKQKRMEENVHTSRFLIPGSWSGSRNTARNVNTNGEAENPEV
jgi:hypothetical protein